MRIRQNLRIRQGYKMKRMNILTRTFLIMWLVGSLIAFITHLFIPITVSNLSFWNALIGWQREIALWNLSIIIIIIYSLIKDNSISGKLVVFLTIISLLLGTNHLLTLLINKKIILSNLLNTITNYCMVILGIYITLIK